MNAIIFLFATPTFFYPFLWVCIAIISLSYLFVDKFNNQSVFSDERVYLNK
jgi:hypothetical protein